MTVSPIVPTSTADYIEPTVMIEPSILPAPPVPTEVIASPAEKSADEPVEPLPTEALLEPTTYYTTYTYFTTSYIGNETVINSHLETETNVETATRSSLSEVTEQITASQVSTEQASLTPTGTTTPPTGLISTIRTSDVNDGVTTLLNTDIYGTYIDGLYAQVLESSSEIVAPSAASSTTDAAQPTGVVSINEGKIVDANGVTTTHFTTKAIGTYIDALYAQVLESTSSVVVDEVKKTELPPESESTVTLGTKIFTTGLVRLIEGSIVKDLTTTFYESRVIGTVIDGRYAQIIESTSSFKSGMSSTADILSPTSTLPPASGISPTQAVTTSSPATLEGSQPGDGEDGDDDEDGENQKSKPGFQGKKKTFTPVIRPFSSRPRPTFQPKKKTGDPATTITRTSFTPTVTATPASKSGFGSSRNRFAANRSKVSTNALSEIKPTASSSRRFSRPRSTSAASFGGASSFGGGSRSRSSPSRVQPTASATPSARRGGFNYRSTGRPNAILPTASRSRIRPTGVNPFNRFSSTTPVDEINNNDISGAAVTEDVEHNTASEEEQEEIVTSAPTTTTESPRRANNPLLRFRRPPILQRTVTTTSTTPKPQTTPKRSPSLLRRPDSRSGGAVATTPRSRPTVSLNRIKPRPASSLFPPRGKKPNQDEVEESEKEEQEPNEEIADDEIQDNEYDGSETAEQTSSTTTEVSKNSRRSKALSPVVQIRPFTRRPRTKRQADYGNRYSARYRRPVARASSYDYDYDYSPEPVREVVTRPPTSRGYSSRNSRNQQIQSRDYSRDVQTQQTQPQQQLQPRVRPSSVPSTPRHQFTLRERTPQQTTTSPRSSNFRRPTTSPRRRLSTELTTPSQRLSKPVTRHRPVTTESPSYSRGTIRRFNNQQQSRRTTARSRYRDSNDFDTYSAKPFDGTITVTHRVPTEVTIPVVNGKNTEYKPVITAKPSLEVLAPFQYSSTIGKDGKSTIVLNSDLTSTLPNGFMEVTKFVIFETPTTSVTFTPTTLRGRKTSFSHIVPSTVYEVRPEVSTIQPNLGDNPLANILLSQLLLGNLAQPTIAGQPQTPVTEYKTKTTTYVTTVTSHTSTILPLTFRGKEITTTIVDSSVHVITATEYLTETVVVTPTAVIQPGIANPLNTLLLPALLQAQILNQQTPNPLLKVQPQKQFDELYNLDKQIEDEDAEQRLNKKDEYNEEERKVRESNEEQEQEIDAKPARKKSKLKLKDKDKILDSGSTVVTLYVSGKHPGEFTTVLSTVPINEKSSASVKKREIDSALWNAELFKIQASRTPELGSSFSDEISNYISPVLDEVRIESSEVETPSLESELTYGNRYLKLYQSTHPELLDDDEVSEQNQQSTGHFLLAGHAESAPDQRKASSRSSPFLHREKRDTSPVRKVIRIRVPVSRRKFSTEEGHDYYEGAASSQLEETHGSAQEHTGNEEHERKVKKVLVARRKPIETSEPVRRRILVTKRRPILESGHSDVVEPHQEELEFPSEVEEHLDSIAPTSATRRRVLRTKKRLIHQSVEEAEQIEPSEQAPKRRITVTRKRVVQTGDPGSARDQNMRTLYNYQYSIPSDGPGSSVMVSEVFMSGSGITSQMESDIDFKELMEDAAGGITQANQKPTEGTENYGKEESSTSSSSQESTENQEEPTDGKANEGSTKAVTEHPVESELELKQAIKNDESYLQGDTRESDENEYIHTSKEESTQKPVSGTPSSTPEEPEYYDYSDDVEQPGDEDIASHQGADLSNENFESKDENTDLESSFVTIFPYDMPDSTSSSTASLPDATNTIKTPESSKVELRPLEIGQFGPTEIPVSISDVTEIPVTISMEPMEDPVTITAGFYGVVETDATSTTSQAAPEATSQASPHTTSRVTSQTSSQESSQTTTHITSQTIKPSITPTQSQTPEARTTITDTPNSTDTTEPNDIPKQNDIPIEPATLIEYQTIVKTLTTTRSRTFTYVVTRVSGDEHYVTSSTTVKPDIKTTTVTEILPVLPTQSALTGTSPIGGRGLYVIEPRHNLATKVMANGVEVIVAGDKSTLPGSPLLKVIPTGLAKPITLAPSTLTDHMMMVLPPESQNKEPIVATATLNNGVKMEVTAAASKLISPESVDLGSSFGDASNVVTGSTIIFFDDEVQPTPALGSSIFETSSEHTSIVTKTPALLTSTPALQASQSSVSNTKITSPDDADESMLIEMAADPPTTSGGSSPVNNIFQGFNALGPVINAMADLFQNNFGENKKKNESRPSFNIPQAYLYQKPKDTASKPPTTQVSPVYVPLREPSDSETAESQHLGGMNVFLDIHQRNKPGADRNNIEAALLSGGIAISPGQVITTNSDVIIGKHAVHGPRPPLKPSAKNDIVEGMKPPPPPGTHSQSNHSPSKSTPAPIASSPLKTGGVLAKPNWPVRDQERYPSVLVPHRVALPPPKQEAPPLVPPPLRPQFTHSNNKHISKPGAPDRSSTEQKFSMQIDPPKEPHGKPHKYYKNPTYQRVPYEPLQKESGPSHYEPRPPYRNGPYKNEKNRPAQTKPAVTINREDNNEKTTLVNVSIVHEMNSNQREPFVTTPAVDQTLLVNIQPSQVANVVIPHGISTALIYSGGSSEVPSQKGEIFNEPSPYPDAEVGLVGVAGLSTSGESTHVPSNAVRLDVPVSPQAVDIQSLKRPTHTDLGWHRNQSKRPPTSLLDDASGLEFMTPPPPPHPQISSYVNYHLPKDQTDDQEGEYSVNNEYHAESGENSNPNVKNWPQWDSKINSGLVLPNRPRPFRPFSNYTNDLGPPGVQYSVINSKPVLLGHENTEKQPPIVKGKPSVTSFDNKDEATVSVGLPTNLAPADEVASIPTASNKQDNPIVLRPTFESKREKPLQAKPIYKPKPMPSNKYVDNIKDAMSMDEKPPPPTFETPSYEVPTTLDTAALHSINMANGPDRNTQQQQDDSVVGLTPPVPTMNQPVVERSTKRPSIATERPTFRPSFPTRRTFPTRKRPPPPYKFEIPLSTVATKPKKPSYQENIRPPMASIPSDELAPPMKPVTYHPGKQEYNHSIKLNIGSQQPVSSVSINPVLGGSLKVEEVPQKPEVITADVKVRIHPNKSVILMQNKNHYGNQGNDNAHDASSYHSSSSTIKPPEMFSFNYVENVKDRNVVGNNEPTRRRPAVENSSSFNRDNERPPQQKPSVDGDQPSNVGFGIRVQGVELSNDQDNQASDKYYFSEANSSKKRKPDLDRNKYEVEKVSPPPTPQLYTPTPTPTSPFKAQNSEHMIIGSETIYPQDDIVTIATLPIDNKSMVQFHQVSTANAIQVTAGPSKPLQNYVTPVRNIEQGHSVVPLQLKNVNPPSGSSNIGSGKNGNILVQRPPPRMTTYVVTHTQTHTQTLTVTTTESRIVQSKGQKPSTHTLVVTQTHTSTILDTVTEVRTLIQPTSIVQTVTTTIPQATTTIFPTPVIHATKPTATIENQGPTKITVPDDSDTILVVMTDKNSKNTMPHKELDPNEPVLEIEGAPDDNEVSPNVLLGGLLSQHHLTGNECKPGCKASRNERCQKIDGIMRCVCRPGFARMFAERPCKREYS
ncbi:unnamed protein product [Nesidiocoris tenuis]|uniref:DUF4758 domain-containing protein n=1 Tax=Nesidiocoris tenuis TaxID=355587 RepID=A0A6H5GFB4_9HEMI|nr:unnamed protein product [Nesidiocoris tenuis]